MTRQETDARGRRFGAVFDALGSGFCVVEVRFEADRAVDGRFVEVNPAFEARTGLADAAGRWLSDLTAWHGRGWLDRLGEVAGTGAPARFEDQVEGGERWFELEAFRIGEASSREVAILLTDISDRKRAELALRQSQEQLERALAAGHGIGTWDWDVPGDRVRADERFAKLYGVDPALARRGARIDEFFVNIHPDDLPALRDAIGRALTTGELFAQEYRLVQPDGDVRWVAAQGRCELSEAGAPIRFPGVTFDVTDQRRADLQRASLLELGDRLRDLSDPAEMAFEACAVLGRALGVSRVGYGVIDKEAETIAIERDWNAPGVRSLAGVLQFRDYGSYIDDLKRGEAVVFCDAETDPRTRETAAALKAISAQAVVNMPLIEHGRFVALLYANHAFARAWHPDELALMGEVAERVHVAAERARAEHARRESEERFRGITNSIDQMIWSTRPDGFHDYWNDRWYAYTGLPRGSTHDGAWNDTFHPDDQERARSRWRHSLVTGDPYHIEYRLRHRSGAYRWVLGRAQPVRDAEGRITRWFGTCTDIEEIVEAREVLARSREELERAVEERTRALRDSMEFTRLALSAVGGVGVWTYDARHDRFLCDEAIAGLHGLDPHEAAAGIARERFLANVHPEDLPGLASTMAGGLDREGDVEAEYRVRLPDGTVRWVLSRGHTYRDDAGLAVRRTGVGIDTTRQRELEEQLRQSQKMEAVGQLTGGIAHDFNNLLTGITGSLELLTSRIAQGRTADVERYTSAAQGAARRAAALTHRLLAFSRRQTLDPKPTNVNTLVAGMEELVRRTVGPAIGIEVVAAGGLWQTLVDPNQLENALLNLCINARDAMPDGGRLTIETANRWLDDHAARQRDLPAGQYISLCVSDTGTGMAPEIVAKAFDPFFTTKPIGMGTGLGLSMIYGFTRQSGGQVRIYSEVGEGTMVCLYLPRHRGAAEEAEPESAPRSAPRAEVGETVLVVDDEPTIRMLVTEVLEELGYGALEAGDGPAGVRILRSDARVDLLVTDVGLPGGMNGRQLAELARSIRPGLKVLFITGYAENAVLGHGHLDPGMHVLTKPFAMEVLASRIKDLIASP